MEYFVSSILYSLIHLKMCSQWYDRHVFKQVTLWKVPQGSEGQKHVFLLSQFQKECKIEKEFTRCGHRADTRRKRCHPVTGDSYSLVSTHTAVSRHKHTETNEPSNYTTDSWLTGQPIGSSGERLPKST